MSGSRQFWSYSNRVTRHPRKYPVPKVGDRFGDWRVVAIAPKTGGRSDMRLELKCSCGRRTITYEYNARKFTTCWHGKART